ncbi:MAG: PHP domain-containing protein [Nitrospinota bacterium]|nr:MAG: PHP domain-containing protein [Nitrospinota bacterium]
MLHDGKGVGEVLIDLHVHTNVASYDSNLDPVTLIRIAKSIGLHGVCVTEHDKGWDLHAAQKLAREHDFVFLRGMEVTTDLGHILVYGLEEYVPGILYAETLRQVVDRVNGVMVAAHPFRKAFTPLPNTPIGTPPPTLTVEEACSLPVFEVVDAIEVLNGGTGDRENALALAVSQRLQMRGTGGSDAHSEMGLGCYVTEFENPIRDEADLIRELKRGRYRPVNRRGRPLPPFHSFPG